jgi:hypothetical protein
MINFSDYHFTLDCDHPDWLMDKRHEAITLEMWPSYLARIP